MRGVTHTPASALCTVLKWVCPVLRQVQEGSLEKVVPEMNPEGKIVVVRQGG